MQAMDVAPRAAGRAAFVAAGVHVVAAVAMLLWLQPGLPVAGSTVPQGMAYLAEHTVAWWVGWLIWQAADLALLAYYVGLAGRWWRGAPIRCGVALLGAAAGVGADVGAQAIYMGVAPRLDAQGFAVAEAVVGVLTGYVANGLYTVAGMLLVWAGARDLPRHLLLLSLPVWGAGVGLSAASLAGSATGQFWSVALLMPAFIVWSGLMGRWLTTRAS
jgi:hypothetical protein